MQLLPNDEFISIQEAASYLRVSPKTLRRWEQSGLLLALRTSGGHRRYSSTQLINFKKLKRSTKKSYQNKSILTSLSINSFKPRKQSVNHLLELPNLQAEQNQADASTIQTKLYEPLHVSQKNILKYFFYCFALVLFITAFSLSGIQSKILSNLSAINEEAVKIGFNPHSKFESEKISNYINNTQEGQVLADTTAFQTQSFNVYVNTNLAKNVNIGNDLTIQGENITTDSETFNLLNDTTLTLNIGSAATILNIADAAITGTIDIGGVTANGATTVNIATEGTTADTLAFGNSNAGTTFALTGGDDWGITAAGVITAETDETINGIDIASGAISDVTTLSTSSGTSTPLSLVRTASGAWIGMNDGTDTFGYYNNAGTPESVVAANIGSVAVDTTNGTVYVKTTDTVNTGWSQLATASSNYGYWTLSDGSTTAQIGATEQVNFIGGAGIDTATTDATPNLLTLTFDSTEIGTTTWGTGTGTVWTFESGAVDPTLTFASNQLTIGGAATLTATAVTDFDCTDCIDFDDIANSATLDEATDIALGALTLSTSGTGALDFNSTGQVSFAGNVNAENGLDVTNASLTIGGSYSITTGGVITAAVDETINGIDISSASVSDVVDLALVLGATNDVTIDATTTDNTGTTGVLNLDLDSTSSQQAINLDAEVIDDNAVDTVSVLNILGTQSSNDGDHLYGINIENLGGTASTGSESALRIGTGWDDILNYNGTSVINGTGQIVAGQITGTLFTAQTDTGVGGASTIVQGDTLIAQGDTNGIDVTNSSDTLTFAFDGTEVGAETWGTGTGFTWTFDVGTTDPTLAFADNALTIGGAATLTATSITDLDCTDCIDFDDIANSATLDEATTITNALAGNLDIDLTSTGDFTIEDGGTTYWTFGDDKNITYNPLETSGLTITSDLTAAARSTDVFTITQGNNTSFNSTGNLLQITNSDTATTNAMVELAQNATGGEFIYFAIPSGYASLNGAIYMYAGYNVSSGNAISIGQGAGSSSNTTDFSGNLIGVSRGTAGVTRNTAGTTTESGNYLDIERDLRVNHASGIINVTGNLTTLTSEYTETLGAITDSSHILSLNQNCGTNVDCTGAVLDITNAGTGQGLLLTSSSTGDLLDLNSSGAVTTANGILIEADHASGVITDALDVSDAEIVNALNIGANEILGTTGTINFTNFDVASTGNITISSGTTLPISLTRTSAGQWIGMNDGTDTFGVYNNAGTPESAVAANIGSLALDTTNGNVYVKTTDTVNTGWTQLSTGGASPFTDGTGITYLTDTAEDFAVGGSTLDAAFSVDIDTNTARIGDGADANAVLNMYASNDATGSITYTTADEWNFTGGGINLDSYLDLDSTSATAMTMGDGTNNYFTFDGSTDAADTIFSFNSAASGVTTGSLASFLADTVTSGTGINVSVDALDTGTGVLIDNAANTLTTGTLLQVQSTSTAVTAAADGLLGYYNWNPGSATTATGDLFRINIGSLGNITNLLNITDNGSTLFRVSETQIESAVPHAFTAAGDVSIAYDLVFTNQTASVIDSYGPLTIRSGESFENNNLTLSAYGTGNVILDPASTGYVQLEGATRLNTQITLADDATPDVSAGSWFVTGGTTTITDFDAGSGTLEDGHLIVIESAHAVTVDCAGSTEFYCGTTDIVLADNDLISFIYDAVEDIWRLVGWVDESTDGGQDIAEYFPSIQTLLPGEVVKVDPENAEGIIRSASAYESRVVGIVSTDPGIILGENSPVSYPVALAGRVPVKIDQNSDPVIPGDYITTSTQAGYAMKASENGRVIGQALEPWTPETGKETISVFINNTWYEPKSTLIVLTESGDVAITGNADDGFFATYADTSKNSDTVVAFADAIIANIKAGAIEVASLISPNIKTQLISPLADQDSIAIKIGNSATAASGELQIHNSDNEVVASIDETGSANFSGDVTANKIYADEVISDSILSREDIEVLLAQATANQQNLDASQNWSIDTATQSATLNELALENLFVTGIAAFDTASITSSVTIGNDLVIQAIVDENSELQATSLDTLNAPLALQAAGAQPLNIMAGKVVIDIDGNVTIAGNLKVEGKVETSALNLVQNPDDQTANVLSLKDELGENLATINASGSAEFKSVKADTLKVTDDPEATSSASLAGVVYQTNSSAGRAKVPANYSEVSIQNPNVVENSLVFVTPTSSTGNLNLYIKSQTTGQITVGFDTPIATDVEFNWWIVGVE